ncbi:MAG: hypothetical protein ACRES4_01270 [Nevskiales bacterium]
MKRTAHPAFLSNQLSPNSAKDDVLEEVRFRKAVEAGIAAADRGAFASDKEVKEAFAKWSVKTCGSVSRH